MNRGDHFEEIVGLFIEVQIAPNGWKNLIMWAVSMEIAILLIIRGSPFIPSKLCRKRKQLLPK